jgi:hypothetical protein
MWSFPLQIGLATTTMNFSTDFSWAGIGLLAAVTLSAGMILFSMLEDGSVEAHTHAPVETETVPYQEAA